MRRGALRALGALASLLAWTTASYAAPPLWARAQEPRRVRAERSFERLERIFDGVTQADGDPEMMQDFRLGTLAIAEMTGAPALGEPRLSLLQARAVLGANLGREAEASELLTVALGLVDDDSAWLEAELRATLAESYRKQPALAVAAVTRALRLVVEPAVRADLLRERAEARLSLGRVRESVADARSALAGAATTRQATAARMVLALALERAYDLPSALAVLSPLLASAPPKDDGALASDGSFSFRPYDVAYAAALLAMAEAGIPASRERELAAWQRAIAAWSEYESSAPAGDAWLAQARAHRAECQRKAGKIERSAARVD